MVGGGFCDPALLRPGSSGLAISRGPEGHPHVSRRGDSWGTTWGEPVASAWKLTRPHLPCWPRPRVLLTACSRGRQRGCVISCLFLHNLPGVVFRLRRSAWRSLEAPCPIEAELVAGGNDGAVTGVETLLWPSWVCFPWGRGGRFPRDQEGCWSSASRLPHCRPDIIPRPGPLCLVQLSSRRWVRTHCPRSLRLLLAQLVKGLLYAQPLRGCEGVVEQTAEENQSLTAR